MSSSYHVVELPADCVRDGTLVVYEQDTPECFVLRRSVTWRNGGMDAAAGAAFLTRVEPFKHSLEPMKLFYLGGEPSNRTLIVEGETRLRLTFKDTQDLVTYLRDIRDPGGRKAAVDAANKAAPAVRAHEWEELVPQQGGMIWRCKVCGARTNAKETGPHWKECWGEESKKHTWVEVHAKDGDTSWECKDCGFKTDSYDDRMARGYETCPGTTKAGKVSPADKPSAWGSPWFLVRLRTLVSQGSPDVLIAPLGGFSTKEQAIAYAAGRTRPENSPLGTSELDGYVFTNVNDRALIVGPDGTTQLVIDQLRAV